MLKAANLWDGDNPSPFGRLELAWEWSIATE
jgi:hypothetical protein